ncbi:MAG: hypothetical protein M1377_01345 [Deltaproteobacteria bacterium]|nr:hypothetical protein [Deltaproteobacteria bacterium]
MPDRPCWYFCRTCGYRGQFVAGEKDAIECPECRKRYVTTIMGRQDVEWLKKERAA